MTSLTEDTPTEMCSRPFESVYLGPDGVEEWHRVRQQGIGGSDAPAVMGCNPWCTPLQVWAMKRGIKDPQEETEYMRWGHILEPTIRSELERALANDLIDNYGKHVARSLNVSAVIQAGWESETFRSTRWPHMQANLDGVIYVVFPGEDHYGIVECKNVGFHMRDDWEDGPPIYVLIQVHHNMLVMGLKHAYVAVLVGGNQFDYYHVDLDGRLVEEILEREELFWGMVVRDEMPPASMADSGWIDLLYPEIKVESVQLPYESLELRDRMLEAQQIKKIWADKEEWYKAQIKSMIGEAEQGTLNDGAVYTWKKDKRGIRTLRYREPRR